MVAVQLPHWRYVEWYVEVQNFIMPFGKWLLKNSIQPIRTMLYIRQYLTPLHVYVLHDTCLSDIVSNFLKRPKFWNYRDRLPSPCVGYRAHLWVCWVSMESLACMQGRGKERKGQTGMRKKNERDDILKRQWARELLDTMTGAGYSTHSWPGQGQKIKKIKFR